MDKSLEVLKNSLSQLHECEQNGIHTLGELNKQKEQINRASNATKSINSELSLANRILNKLKSICSFF
jgi:hypothetical protein